MRQISTPDPQKKQEYRNEENKKRRIESRDCKTIYLPKDYSFKQNEIKETTNHTQVSNINLENKLENNKFNNKKGEDFEKEAKSFFERKYKCNLEKTKIITGLAKHKEREFDLVNKEKKIVIECKNVTYTNQDNEKKSNVPPAKIAECVMDLFKLYILNDDDYTTKILCLKKYDPSVKKYIEKNYADYIPKNIELIEI